MAKEILFNGKTADEMKKLDMKEFMTMIPSRSRRSMKRTNDNPKYQRLRKKIVAFLTGKRKKPVKTQLRDAIITPDMIGMTLKVYNGKEYQDVLVMEPMLGHFLGEFAYTRKLGTHSGPGIGATKSSKAAKK